MVCNKDSVGYALRKFFRNRISLDKVLRENRDRQTDASDNGTPRVYSVDKDFLAVENINCVDADGNIFEQYNKLLVSKDVVRSDDGKHINFTSYRAIAYLETVGSLFLSSLALNCNINAALYQHRDDPEVNSVLMQYKDYGTGFGWHTQNTVIDWREQKIIHYPHKGDFTNYGGRTEINQAQQRTVLPFTRKENRKIFWENSLCDTTLENGLNDSLMVRFVRQLTGLQDPSILVEIGNYFGKTARVWVSSSNDARTAWFGCGSNGFYLDCDCALLGDNAARGVKRA